MTRIAAIDVGSNAMRMVVGEVDEAQRVRAIQNVRLPVRLGWDVFSKGYLEEETIRQTEEAFLEFRRLAEKFEVGCLRAVATSAAREARNNDLLLERVFQASGIEIELISGEEEARLIHMAVVHELNLKNKRTSPVDKRTLLIDIGGGSVEVTLSTGQEIISTDSFSIGTVRLLEKLDGSKRTRHALGKLIREYVGAERERIKWDLGDQKIQICAGTGGNVEELGRLRQRLLKGESNRLITLEELESLIERLDRLTYEERMRKLKLRPDRADVILPASIVLHVIASEARATQILIPNVGLKDGILLNLARDLCHASGSKIRLAEENIWQG